MIILFKKISELSSNINCLAFLAHRSLAFCVPFLFIALSGNAQQITTDSSIPLEQLILNNLAEGCIEISNISSSVNGVSSGFNSYGYLRGAIQVFLLKMVLS